MQASTLYIGFSAGAKPNVYCAWVVFAIFESGSGSLVMKGVLGAVIVVGALAVAGPVAINSAAAAASQTRPQSAGATDAPT
jgi:hypothetical protein